MFTKIQYIQNNNHMKIQHLKKAGHLSKYDSDDARRTFHSQWSALTLQARPPCYVNVYVLEEMPHVQNVYQYLTPKVY